MGELIRKDGGIKSLLNLANPADLCPRISRKRVTRTSRGITFLRDAIFDHNSSRIFPEPFANSYPSNLFYFIYLYTRVRALWHTKNITSNQYSMLINAHYNTKDWNDVKVKLNKSRLSQYLFSLYLNSGNFRMDSDGAFKDIRHSRGRHLIWPLKISCKNARWKTVPRSTGVDI